MAISRLKDGSTGDLILINPNHVVFVGRGMQKSDNGATGLTLVIGKSVVVTVNGLQIVVEGTVEEVYTALMAGLRRSESHLAVAER